MEKLIRGLIFLLVIAGVLGVKNRRARISNDWNNPKWSWTKADETGGFWEDPEEERNGRGGAPDQWKLNKPEQYQKTQADQSSNINPELWKYSSRGSRLQKQPQNREKRKQEKQKRTRVRPGSGTMNSRRRTVESVPELYMGGLGAGERKKGSILEKPKVLDENVRINGINLNSRFNDKVTTEETENILFNNKQQDLWLEDDDSLESQLERVKFDTWLEEEAEKLINGEEGVMLDALHKEMWSDTSTETWQENNRRKDSTTQSWQKDRRDSTTKSWQKDSRDSTTQSWQKDRRDSTTQSWQKDSRDSTTQSWQKDRRDSTTKSWHKESSSYRRDPMTQSWKENNNRRDFTTHSWQENANTKESTTNNWEKNNNRRVWQNSWDQDEMTTRGGSTLSWHGNEVRKTEDRRRWEDALKRNTEDFTMAAPENWTEGDRIKQLERLKVSNNVAVTKCQTADDCMSHQVCYLPTNECKDQLTFSLSQRSACSDKTDCGENQVCLLSTKKCVCNLGFIEQSGTCTNQSTLDTTLLRSSILSNTTKVINSKGWGVIPYIKAWGNNTHENVCLYGTFVKGTGNQVSDDPMIFTGGSDVNCDEERSAKVYYECNSSEDKDDSDILWVKESGCKYIAYIFTALACTTRSGYTPKVA